MPMIDKRLVHQDNQNFEMPNIDKIRMWKRSGMTTARFRPDTAKGKWDNIFNSRMQKLVEDPKISERLRKLVWRLKKASKLA